MNIDISGKEEQLERCVSGQKTRRTEWGHSVRWKRKLWKRGHASSARATERPGEVRHVDLTVSHWSQEICLKLRGEFC